MNLFFKVLSSFLYLSCASFLLSYCSQQKDNQYSVEQVNIKLLTITIIKNTECNTYKEIELIYFPIKKNQIDTCFYEIYFLNCEEWKNNLLPKICQNLNLQLK